MVSYVLAMLPSRSAARSVYYMLLVFFGYFYKIVVRVIMSALVCAFILVHVQDVVLLGLLCFICLLCSYLAFLAGYF